MKKMIYCVAVLASLVSCVEDEKLRTADTRQVSLVAVNPQTKTVLDGNSVLWENGDQVKLVFPSSGSAYMEDFTTEFEGAASATATFQGLLDGSVTEANGFADGFAVYPESVTVEDGVVYFNVPSEQRPRVDGSFAREANLSSSLVDLSDLVDNGRVEVMFRNALALVKFNLPENVASMRITSSTAPLSGNAALEFSADPESEGVLVFADDVALTAENSTVTLLPPSGDAVFASGVTYSMLVWPGVHQLDILLTDADGGMAVKKVNKTFAASMAYTFNVAAEFVKPVSVDITPSVEHRYDADILARSAVNLTLDATPEDLARIRNVEVVVTSASGDVEYKRYTLDKLSAGAISFFTGPKVYMPKGNYNVRFTYEDELGTHVEEMTVVSPAPSFGLEVNFTATNTDITIHSAVAKISENILSELPLKASDGVLIRFSGKTYTDFESQDGNVYKSQFIVDKTKPAEPNATYNRYKPLPYVQFDGEYASTFNYVTSNRTDVNGYFYVDAAKYKVTGVVSRASDLVDGGMYCIRANWDTNKCWYISDASGTLSLSNSLPDLQNLPKEYVFVYDIDQNHSDIAVDSRYKYESGVGAWKSLSSSMYLSTNSPMTFNLPQPGQYVKCASGWEKQDQAGVLDICRNSTEMIGYGSDLYWGRTDQLISGGVQYWKWQVYTVVKE